MVFKRQGVCVLCSCVVVLCELSFCHVVVLKNINKEFMPSAGIKVKNIKRMCLRDEKCR